MLRRLYGLLLIAAAIGQAHDMWIEPSTFAPTQGQVVGVRLRVGQELIGDPIPRSSKLVNQFVVEDAAGRKQVMGREGADPAGVLRVEAPGLMVVGYRSNASAVELPAEKFNQYLKEEGLEAILAQRARRNESGLSGNELFSRCAKSLVLAGPASASQGDRTLGFPLELVAERNPYTVREGESLPVRLTYENRPLAGALVVAIHRTDPSLRQSARTDKQGRVRFRVRSGGMWLFKAVHMVAAPAGSGAQWASYWASLTFERPAVR